MPSRVNVDVVPQTARPVEVEKALSEALVLRGRLRAAQEEAAAAEAEYEQRRQADVADAAERARKGSPLGAVPAAVEKARQQVELAKRNAAAIGLASEAAQTDLASVMQETSTAWLAALDAEQRQERERALAAFSELEQALAGVTRTASASLWLASAGQDQRWDRRLPMASTGTVARSSAKATANGAPLDRATLLAYVRELVGPEAAGARGVEPDAKRASLAQAS